MREHSIGDLVITNKKCPALLEQSGVSQVVPPGIFLIAGYIEVRSVVGYSSKKSWLRCLHSSGEHVLVYPTDLDYARGKEASDMDASAR